MPETRQARPVREDSAAARTSRRGASIHVSSPARTGPDPELAVVVLSVGAPPELRTALESLARQTVPLEIVIVNSGGGDPSSRVPDDLPDARIVSVPERLWPGAARNVGIRETRAPWVAFMASDLVASNDWAAERLELHRRGHSAVACAILNSHPRSLVAWAYHCSILARRLPGTPAHEASLHGVSYSRSLFDEYGEFREDLRIGEDTEFNCRLPDADCPVWAPSVQATHRNPTRFGAMIKSQYHRGRRSGLYWPHWHQGSLPARVRQRFSVTFLSAFRATRGLERCLVMVSSPLLLACVAAYSLGVSATRDKRGQGEEAPGAGGRAGATGRSRLAGDVDRTAP